MKRTFRYLGWALLASILLSIALLVVAVLAAAGSDHTILINGETLDQLDGVGSVVAIGGVALAFLIVVLVLPLVVLIPLGIVCVAIAGVLLVIAGVLAMVFSPLILVALTVWLMVRVARGGKAANRGAGSATIVA